MKQYRAAGFTLVLAAAALSGACGPAPGAEAAGAASEAVESGPAAATLAMGLEVGVANARVPVPGVLSGGQPTEEQVDELMEAGFTHFISLRPADERGAGWEEARLGGSSSDFARLEIAGAQSLTRENVDAFAAMLAATDGEPTVLYCASGNRVGAMLALKAHWVDGADAEAALALGLEGGMTRLEGPVRELLGLNPSE